MAPLTETNTAKHPQMKPAVINSEAFAFSTSARAGHAGPPMGNTRWEGSWAFSSKRLRTQIEKAPTFGLLAAVRVFRQPSFFCYYVESSTSTILDERLSHSCNDPDRIEKLKGDVTLIALLENNCTSLTRMLATARATRIFEFVDNEQ